MTNNGECKMQVKTITKRMKWGTEKIKIDMWYNDKYETKQYRADAYFYPHGNLYGDCYAGNIYNDSGAIIGDYSATGSVIIEDCFIIHWKD